MSDCRRPEPKARDAEAPELFRVWTRVPEVVRAGSARTGETRRSAKMLLDLSEEHKEHLAFLPQVDSAG